MSILRKNSSNLPKNQPVDGGHRLNSNKYTNNVCDTGSLNYLDLSADNLERIKDHIRPRKWCYIEKQLSGCSENDRFIDRRLHQLILLACCIDDSDGWYGRFFDCGFQKLPKGGYASCNNPRICEKCARKQQRSYVRKYRDLLEKGTFSFVTVSFPPISVGDSDFWVIQEHWQAIQSEMAKLHNQNRVDGYILQHELAVTQLYPNICVNPHAHVICHNLSTDTNEVIEWLQRGISGYLNEDNESTVGRPDIKVERVKTASDFERRLAYLKKPIDLDLAYHSGIVYCDENNLPYQGVNQNLKNVVDLIYMSMKGERHMLQKGTMHARTRNSLLPKQTKASQRGKSKATKSITKK